MNCKFCGTKLKDEDNFCYVCGAPQQKPKHPKIKSFILNLLKALGYFLALDLIINIVVGVYTFLSSFITILLSVDTIQGWSYDKIFEYTVKNISQYINIAYIVAYIIALFALFIFFAIRKKSMSKETCLNNISNKTVLLAIILGLSTQVFCNFLLSLIISILPHETTNSFTTLFNPLDAGSIVFQVINIAIIAPIFEEILFRGLIFTRIRRSTSPLVASLISAAIFGLAHGNIFAFFYTFYLGFLICLIVERSNSIIPGIFVHFAFNLTSFLYQLVPDNLVVITCIFIVCSILMIVSAYLLLKKPKQEEKINVETL